MKTWRKLFIVFIIIVILKTILAAFIPTLSAYSDEYFYAKMARSLFNSQTLAIHGKEVGFYPPLYPLLLSVSYIFKNMEIVYFFMKLSNAIISSLIIIPAFLIGKNITSEKNAFLASIVIGVLPSTFALTPYLLSENLFYVLVLTSFYFVYKAVQTEEVKYGWITGVFISFAVLTKWSAIILIPVPLVIALWNSIIEKNKFKIYLSIISRSYLVILLITGLWLLRNARLFGFSLNGIFGSNLVNDITSATRAQHFLPSLITWIVSYASYLLIASGILFGLLAVFGLKKFIGTSLKKGLFTRLALITIGFFVLVGANHATGGILYPSPLPWLTDRPIGRYIDTVLPIVILLAFMVFDQVKSLSGSLIIGSSIFAAFSSILTFAPLFPSNNISLSWLGSLDFLIKLAHPASMVIIAVILFITTLLFIKFRNLNHRTLLTFLMLFFIVSSILSLTVTFKQAQKWEVNKQIFAVKNLFPKDLNGGIIFDKDSCSEKITSDSDFICEGELSTISGFWINQDIKIGDPYDFSDETFKYVFSTRNLPLKDGIRAGIIKYRGFILYKRFL